jgi:hypothetical protein
MRLSDQADHRCTAAAHPGSIRQEAAIPRNSSDYMIKQVPGNGNIPKGQTAVLFPFRHTTQLPPGKELFFRKADAIIPFFAYNMIVHIY